MSHVQHFSHGWFNPVMAFSLAFLGSFLGLSCTARAQEARGRHRSRWLALGAVSIGGVAIWLLHFMAMLGFDVPGSLVRYNVGLTALSMLIAIATVGLGLAVAGLSHCTVPRLLGGGVLTGFGVVAMHYTGMAAVRVAGRITYDMSLVLVSVVIAVVAATVALWFAVSIRRDGHVAIAAFIMACAIFGMHYTGMFAVRVQLEPSATDVTGVRPVQLMIPLWVLTAGALLAISFTALQTMTREEMAKSAPRARSRLGVRP